MNPPCHGFTVQRLAVAVDTSTRSRPVVEVAALLAAEWGAELRGFFVEDIDLLHLAQYPTAREVGWSAAGASMQLTYQRMERLLRVHAVRVRETVVTVTAQRHVPATLQVARGRVVDELVAASRSVDFLVLGRGGSDTARLGTVAQRVALTAACSVMLVGVRLGLGGMVIVIYDTTTVSERTLCAAACCAMAAGLPLQVLIPSSDAKQFASRRDMAHACLPEGNMMIGYQATPEVDMLSALCTLPHALVVVAGAETGHCEAVLNSHRGSLLVIR